MAEESSFWIRNSIVSVSDDGMSGRLMLWAADDETVTVDEVVEFLKANRIINGINREEIGRIIDTKDYLREIVVARGKLPTPGKDGYFEFLFEVNKSRSPKILEDGSVDYSNYNAVTIVKKDQLLVQYHHATSAIPGEDVTGNPIYFKNGAEIPKIKGKGFYISEEGDQYFASFDGRAEYNNGLMVVSNQLQVDGNVDNVFGNIDFSGDVFVKGDVRSNMIIKASGFISVNGHVEGAHLISKKGILLRNGMQGSGFGTIECGGDVEGKFFEQVTINVGGNVRANAILNCDIVAGNSVEVEGNLGALVGGNVKAGTYIKASYIGNINSVNTKLITGTDGNVEAEIKKIQEDIKLDTTELFKIEGQLKMIESMSGNASDEKTINEAKRQILRRKIMISGGITDKEARLKKLFEAVEKSVNACVLVNKQIYPGTTVVVNGGLIKIHDVVNCVTIRRRDNNVVMFPGV